MGDTTVRLKTPLYYFTMGGAFIGDYIARATNTTVRVKLRYALSLAQMVLVVVLLWQSNLWFEKARRLSDMPGPAPAFTLCVSINAPVVLFRLLWFRHLSYWADSVVLVLAVGALWYWVGLNVESWQRNRTLLVIPRLPLRLATDLILFLIGVFCGLLFVSEMRRGFMYFQLRDMWALVIWSPQMVWSLGLIFFFGRDFILGVRERKSTP